MRRQHQERRADRRRGGPSPRGRGEDTWGGRASTQGERPSSSELWRGENKESQESRAPQPPLALES